MCCRQSTRWGSTTNSRRPRRLAAFFIRRAEGRPRTAVRAAENANERRGEDCSPYQCTLLLVGRVTPVRAAPRASNYIDIVGFAEILRAQIRLNPPRTLLAP